MNIVFICVNYNSYSELDQFLRSIEIALSKTKNQVRVSVLIADNSEQKRIVDENKYKGINVKNYLLENKGYLGGAFSVLNSLKGKELYDYFIISNVDVYVQEDFFERMMEISFPTDVSWMAPEIFISSLHKIGNLEMNRRPSKNRMRFYNLMYSSEIVYRLYYYLSRLWIRSSNNEKKTIQKIYAGYGSFMIFSRKFILSQETWSYPSFLFGEEIFFAEKSLRAGLYVYYVPDLVITDIGKVSTGKIASKAKLKMQYDSNKYLYEEFFK